MRTNAAPGLDSIVWLFARVATQIFYRVARIGSRVPDGPVLLVANHPNSLMDPAIVAATAGRPVRFLAKSTLFHGHALSAFIRRSGAIPVYRRVDGVDMSKNEKMFAAVETALALGDAVCLFPEGMSHSTGRLEQLRTGAARIVLGCAARGVGIAIVPVGLNFDRKSRFRSRVTVAFGAPFQADDLAAGDGADRQAAAVRALTARIGEHLRNLIVEADPRTDAQIVARIDELYSAARGVRDDPAARLQRRRVIAAGVEALRAKDPEQYAAIREKVRRYDDRLARFGLRDRSLGWSVPRASAIRFAGREALYVLALLPIALAGTLAFAVPYWLTGWSSRRAPLDVRATWQAVAGVIFYGVWTLALAALAWVTRGPAAGLLALAGLPALALATLFAIERETASLRLVRTYLATRQAPVTARARLQRRQEEIAALLERTYEWLERERAGAS